MLPAKEEPQRSTRLQQASPSGTASGGKRPASPDAVVRHRNPVCKEHRFVPGCRAYSLHFSVGLDLVTTLSKAASKNPIDRRNFSPSPLHNQSMGTFYLTLELLRY